MTNETNGGIHMTDEPTIDWPTMRLGVLAAAHRAEHSESVSRIDGEDDAMLTCPPWRRAATLEREERLRAASRQAA